MKKLVFILMMCCTLNSCAVTSTGVSYSSEYSEQYYAGERIEYCYEYYYNGVYYPVIYVNSIPWFYYLNTWYTIPTNRYTYIRYFRTPRYHFVNVRPPVRHTPHRYHPQYKHRNDNHRPAVRPNNKPNNHKPNNPNVRPNNRPNSHKPNNPNVRPNNRPTNHNSSVRPNNRRMNGGPSGGSRPSQRPGGHRNNSNRR